MLDTARHFLSLDAIFKVIDGMVINNLNVLHFHITDNGSFPIEID